MRGCYSAQTGLGRLGATDWARKPTRRRSLALLILHYLNYLNSARIRNVNVSKDLALSLKTSSGETRKKRKYEILDEQIRKIVEEYIDRQRTTIEYLQAIAHNLSQWLISDFFLDKAYVWLLLKDWLLSRQSLRLIASERLTHSLTTPTLGSFRKTRKPTSPTFLKVTLTGSKIRAEFAPNWPRAQ